MISKTNDKEMNYKISRDDIDSFIGREMNDTEWKAVCEYFEFTLDHHVRRSSEDTLVTEIPFLVERWLEENPQ